MLRAMLHGKLRRPADEEKDSSEASAWERLTYLEDPLTAVVFARLTYLESPIAWSLLRSACNTVPGEAHLPLGAPADQPRTVFWPRLSPGEGSDHLHHVEPDVLVEWGPHLLVVEAKHHGTQDEVQWVKEIRAVRANARFGNRTLIFIAAGGVDAAAFGPLVARVRRMLDDDRMAFLFLSWNDLHDAALAQRPGLTGGAVAIVDDILAALDAWGYRHRVGFDSLPDVVRHLALALGPKALQHWRVT